VRCSAGGPPTTSVHPREALLGLLALLDAASSQEVWLVRHEDIDPMKHTVTLPATATGAA